jgi:type IV pilus assembly protein PilV
MNHLPASARARGFTLVEVMVAVVVICVGLLGIAKMQALALSNTSTSRLRSLAALEAASLAAAMHSNRQYWANVPPANVTLAAGPAIASSDGALAAQATADMGNLTACVGNNSGISVCNALQLAAYDVANWTTDLNALLPNPTATIACPPVAGLVPPSCTIQISWTERAVAMNQQAAAVAGGQFATPTYTLYVEP